MNGFLGCDGRRHLCAVLLLKIKRNEKESNKSKVVKVTISQLLRNKSMYDARAPFCMTSFTVLRYQFLRLDLLLHNIYRRFLKGMFGQKEEHLTASFFFTAKSHTSVKDTTVPSWIQPGRAFKIFLSFFSSGICTFGPKGRSGRQTPH